MECGGKRSATPLWIRGTLSALVTGRQTLETTAPSPLRSAGALHSPRHFINHNRAS